MNRAQTMLMITLALALQGWSCQESASLSLEDYEYVPPYACSSSQNNCPIAQGARIVVKLSWGSDTISHGSPTHLHTNPNGVVAYDGLYLKGLAPGTAMISTVAPNGGEDGLTVHVAAPATSRILVSPLEPERLPGGSTAWSGDSVALLEGTYAELFAQHRDSGGQYLRGLGLENWSVKGSAEATLEPAHNRKSIRILRGGAAGNKLTVSMGRGAPLAVEVVGDSAVAKLQLVDLNGKSPAVIEGGTWSVGPQGGHRIWVIAAFTKDGRYLAGGGKKLKVQFASGPIGSSGSGPLNINLHGNTRLMSIYPKHTGTDTLTVTLGGRTATFSVKTIR